MKNSFTVMAGLAMLAVGTSSVAYGVVPEIDPASGVNALALLAGALLVVRGRRRR